MKSSAYIAVILAVSSHANLFGGIVHQQQKPNLVEGIQSTSITRTHSGEKPKAAQIVAHPLSDSTVGIVRSKPEEPSRFSDYTLFVEADTGSASTIKMAGVYDDCTARWISEKLLFIRCSWARNWGADYIYDTQAEAFIYTELYNSRETEDGEQDASGQPATPPRVGD